VLVTGASKESAGIAQWFRARGAPCASRRAPGTCSEREADAIRNSAKVDVQVFADRLGQDAGRKASPTPAQRSMCSSTTPARFRRARSTISVTGWRAGWELKVFGYVALSGTTREMKARRRGVIVNIMAAPRESARTPVRSGIDGQTPA